MSRETKIPSIRLFIRAIRRLMYSVEFWGKGSFRGYCQHVLPFLGRAGYDVMEDKIHFTVLTDPDNWK